MDTIEELNAGYKDYMLSRPSEMADERKALDRRLLERNCIYNEGPIPTFMKPLFLAPYQEEIIRRACRLLYSAIEKVTDLYFSSREFARSVGLSREEEEMMKIEPGFPGKVVLARFDGFIEGKRLTFLEFNTDSPAGLADGDILSEEFLALSPMKFLSRDCFFRREEMKDAYFRVLIDKFREFGGSGTPRIAIVDWSDVKNRTEFYLLAGYFEGRGCPSRVLDPRELKLKDGRLWGDGFLIDLVIRRVIVRELAERWPDVGDFIEAARRRAACFVNPFRSKLGGFKGLLNILSNTRYWGLFSEEEREAIEAHIPWSRPAKRGKVNFHGEVEDIKKLLLGRKDRFVIKPSHGYGGEGIHLGYMTDPSTWGEVVGRALEGDFIVQEVITVPEEEFPVFSPELAFSPKKVNINPFVLAGEYIGSIARVSDSPIINLTRGGGQLPVFTCHFGSLNYDKFK